MAVHGEAGASRALFAAAMPAPYAGSHVNVYWSFQMAQINTNLLSVNAQRNTSSSQMSLGVSMQRLSSGLRVNSAKDDSAGLAIAERMRSSPRHERRDPQRQRRDLAVAVR
jgi:hypothetical protein